MFANTHFETASTVSVQKVINWLVISGLAVMLSRYIRESEYTGFDTIRFVSVIPPARGVSGGRGESELHPRYFCNKLFTGGYRQL